MHHGASLLPLFGMWAAMMLLMMAPLEAPSVVQVARARGPLAAAAFLAGSFAPWIAFSLGAALLQETLHAAGLLDHHSGALANPLLAAALFVAVGIVQITPWKRACARRCREAVREGSWTAGLRAGALSVSSCGLLMLLPFATGMALWPMALMTLLLVAERLAPSKWPISEVAGAMLAGGGVFVLVG